MTSKKAAEQLAERLIGAAVAGRLVAESLQAQIDFGMTLRPDLMPLNIMTALRERLARLDEDCVDIHAFGVALRAHHQFRADRSSTADGG